MHNESSLRHKVKSSFLCFTGDLRSQSLHRGDSSYNALRASNSPTTPYSPSLSCSRRKKSSHGDLAGHHRGRTRYLLSRIRWKHHRHAQSPDFNYDPFSYALNFEDDCRIEAEDLPCRGFASRLKHSPLPSANFTYEILVTMPREIVGFS